LQRDGFFGVALSASSCEHLVPLFSLPLHLHPFSFLTFLPLQHFSFLTSFVSLAAVSPFA
jgi:hypothetical protein